MFNFLSTMMGSQGEPDQPPPSILMFIPVDVWKQVWAFHSFDKSEDCCSEELQLRSLCKSFNLSLPLPKSWPQLLPTAHNVYVGCRPFQLDSLDGAVALLTKMRKTIADPTLVSEIFLESGVYYINNEKDSISVGKLLIDFDLKITGISSTESYILGSIFFPKNQGGEYPPPVISLELKNLTLSRGLVEPEYNDDIGISGSDCGVHLTATDCVIQHFKVGINFNIPTISAGFTRCYFEDNDIGIKFEENGDDVRCTLSLTDCIFYQHSHAALVMNDMVNMDIHGARTHISKTGFGSFCKSENPNGSIHLNCGAHLYFHLPLSHCLFSENDLNFENREHEEIWRRNIQLEHLAYRFDPLFGTSQVFREQPPPDVLEQYEADLKQHGVPCEHQLSLLHHSRYSALTVEMDKKIWNYHGLEY